jgi:hypothetical protein
LTYHLAGGVGGIDHFLDQFAGPMANWWETLGNPAESPSLAGLYLRGQEPRLSARVSGLLSPAR